MLKYIPPTDSIYKFAAISGLILIFVPSYFYMSRIFELEESSIAVKYNLEIHRIEQEYLTYETDYLKKFMDRVEENVNKNKERITEMGEQDVLDMEQDVEKINTLKEKIVELSKQQERNQAGIERQVAIDANNLENLSRYNYLFAFGLALGFFFTFWGFWKWYQKEERAHSNNAWSWHIG